MRALWPYLACTILSVTAVFVVITTYMLGSVVGQVLENIIRAVPGVLYEVPAKFDMAWDWFVGVLWAAISNPLRTICLILGILIVITLFRGISGQFDDEPSIFRGSNVRTAEDIFPDFDDPTSEIDFNSFKEPIWTRLWQLLKSPFTRTSGGDDLL